METAKFGKLQARKSIPQERYSFFRDSWRVELGELLSVQRVTPSSKAAAWHSAFPTSSHR
jgi:hypothetical protein